jgi:hypothetical protein
MSVCGYAWVVKGKYRGRRVQRTYPTEKKRKKKKKKKAFYISSKNNIPIMLLKQLGVVLRKHHA